MTNHSKYFTFILVTIFSIAFLVAGLAYYPELNPIHKTAGEVFGATEVKAPDLDSVPDQPDKFDLINNQTIELQIKYSENNKLLMRLPAKIKNQIVERGVEAFYIPCQNGPVNQVSLDLESLSTTVPNATSSNLKDIKKFLKIKQTTLDDKCKLSSFEISEIIDNIEIRQINNLFKNEQTTSIFYGKNVDYLLNGNCILSATIKNQAGKYTEKCSLWSLPHGQIYPDLISNKLRNWFETGDIYFFKKSPDQESPNSTKSDLGYKLVNLDAIKRQASIFYIKDDALKLSDFREITDLSKASQYTTGTVIALPDSQLQDYFYRRNKLPLVDISSTNFPTQSSDQVISCFWTTVTQSEFWYREPLPSLPLTRDLSCKIGAMVASQNVKNLKITQEELMSGDSWYLDKSAILFNQNIFKSLQDLGYTESPTELCKKTGASEIETFKRQLCPFGITSLDDLNNLNLKLELNSKQVGSWQTQSYDKDDFSYQVYTKVSDNGLWVYWYELKKDSNLSEKILELNRIMEKVVIK